MRYVPFRTLRGRLLLLASLATLPALLFVVWVAAQERRMALRRAESDARYVAGLASREHAQQVEGAARLLERLATIPESSSERELERILPVVLRGFPQVANLGLITTSGALSFSVVPPPRDVDWRGNKAFTEALRQPGVAVGEYQLGPIVLRPVLIMARAIRSAAGDPQRIVFAALELAWLDDLARHAELPPDHVLYIADGRGNVLAQSSAQPEHGRLSGFDEMIRERQGMTLTRAGSGEDLLAVAAPLRGARNLWVVVAMPETNVYAAANRIFYRDFAVLVLFTTLALVSTLVATDLTVLRDLRLLARATRQFGQGDYSARAPEHGSGGEIRDLTASFNAMAAALEERHREALSTQERLRALSHRLQKAREEEAARIAQELHDQLGQELSVLKLELESLRRKIAGAVASEPAAPLYAAIDEIGGRIDTTVETVRRISSDLRPGVLDRLGLVAGLEWLLRDFERRTPLTATFVAAELSAPVDAETSTALFRITQEALANVARHSGATAVTAELREAERSLQLIVTDDGRGFEAAFIRAKPSLGLLGMEERAQRLGGTFSIEPSEEGGTRIVVEVPKHVRSQTEGRGQK